mgnify:CR=1 FL=1
MLVFSRFDSLSSLCQNIGMHEMGDENEEGGGHFLGSEMHIENEQLSNFVI